MTKKILALALAGTTAFSVFGGLNVFAADEKDADAYAGENYPAYHASTVVTLGSYNTDDLKAELIDRIVTDSYEDVTVTDYNGNKKDPIYLFDFVANIKEDEAGDAVMSFNDLVEAVEYGSDKDIVNLLKDYYTAGQDKKMEYEQGSSLLTKAITAARKDVILDFLDVKSASADVDPDIYDKDEWAAYNIAALRTDIEKADVDTTATSKLLYLTQEYNRLMEIVTPTTAYSDQYADLMAKVEALEESDYTAGNWKRVLAIVDDAEDQAAKGTEAAYKKAYAKLQTAIYEGANDKNGYVPAIAPKYTDLRDALSALFSNGKIPTDVAVYAGKGENFVYLKSDYTVKGEVPDTWYDFAGYVDAKDHDNDIEGSYRYALSIYNVVKRSATKQAYGQSVVDGAVAYLEETLAALDPNYSSANWALVRLEEAIEKAQAVDENDYKTTSTKYKAFTKAMAAAEKALETDPIKTKTANEKAKALEEATAALKDCAKTVPTATKNDLKALLKEAKELLKNVDGKNSAQIIALTDAYNDGSKVSGAAGKLISDYTKAIDDLETAIANFSQAQGWYTNAAGKWMYGEGDTVVTNGWKKINNSWYYFNADGTAKQSEWFKDTDGTWYWFTNNCNAARGWVKVDGNWYYFNDGGRMVTGWRMVNGLWYYMDASGKMMTGWVNVGGKSYYLSKEAHNYGAMLANTTTPDGYKVGADGAWIK